jgi:hypothetical protein
MKARRLSLLLRWVVITMRRKRRLLEGRLGGAVEPGCWDAMERLLVQMQRETGGGVLLETPVMTLEVMPWREQPQLELPRA